MEVSTFRVSFVSILCLAIVAAAVGNSCTYCECVQRYRNVGRICRCDNVQNGVVSLGTTLKPSPDTVTFNVSNCETLELMTNSFKSVRYLEDFKVNGVTHVRIQVGVFETLGNMMINDAKVTLDRLAFGGAGNFLSFEFRNVKFDEITENAFYNVKGDVTFLLNNVTIGRIARNAIHHQGLRTTFSMENSQVDNIEENAIDISADTFRIQNTTLHSASTKALSINARDVIFIGNTFGEELDGGAMQLQVHNLLTITNNTFVRLRSGAMDGIKLEHYLEDPSEDQGPRFEFIGNHILDLEEKSLDLNMTIMKSGQIDIRSNVMPCDCAMAHEDLFFSTIRNHVVMRNSGVDLLLENFCDNENCQATLRDFMDLAVNDGNCSSDICERALSLHTSTMLEEFSTEGDINGHPSPDGLSDTSTGNSSPSINSMPSTLVLYVVLASAIFVAVIQ